MNRSAIAAIAALSITACTSRTAHLTSPASTDIACAQEGAPEDIIRLSGSHTVRVVLRPAPQQDVLGIASRLDPAQHPAELHQVGIVGEHAPDCKTPAIVLDVKDGTPDVKLRDFLERQPEVLRVE